MNAPLRVLVVEDEPDIREVAVLSLQLDPGMEVREAGSGDEAIAFLETGAWCPDVILLDMMMAGFDGLATLARIKALRDCAGVDVIFMTARTRESDRAAFVAAGARAVIKKPFAPLDLAAQVRAALES